MTSLKHGLICGFAAAAVFFAGGTYSNADMITGADLGGVAGGAADLGISTFTTTAQNGLLTITGSGNFGGNDVRFGVFGGTNNAAFDDGDGVLGGADAESLAIALNADTNISGNVGALQSLSWDFSRADGPAADSGVFISGFLADPMAVLSGGVANSSVDYSAGTLRLNLAGADFGNTDGVVTLSNLAASAGQNLNLTIADSTQGSPQIAITNLEAVSFTSVPEPTSLVLFSFGFAGLAIRRRR
jgi:hypothetical protein